jgi:hypothetical protein
MRNKPMHRLTTRVSSRWLAVALILSGVWACWPARAETPPAPAAQVLLFGTFHFANPGSDVVRTDQIDVMAEENQEYLLELSQRIAEKFRPTVVLLEFDPAREETMRSEYQAHLAGELELGSNEIYQLGFRVAAQAGLNTVYSFDERTVGWEAEALFEEMKSHEPETQARFDETITTITREMAEAHRTLSLRELLAQHNDPHRDQLNKSIYIMTNHVGAGDTFSGADAAASWWHRNFRMYANIQKHARAGERVLVIGGQGHVAILRDLLELDADREAVDARAYL